jgi:hydroxypyruvate isomerase
MPSIGRRQALGLGAAALGGLFLNARGFGFAPQNPERVVKHGRLKQSVSRWCYNKIPLPEFARAVADMGLTAIDLLDEKEWEVIKPYGLICSMGWKTGGGGIPDGLNNRANHDAIVKGLERSIPLAAKYKVPNLIAFFGNRKGIADAEAAENCVAGLNRIKKVAEDHGVTVCVELLNSKVDHKDYHGDRTPFGVQIVKQVNSPNVKLLYDIYHMQIMEGDVIRTIRDNHQYIAHYHTGGVPGRHELDGTQELNWEAVCKAIVETGFKGFVAHEFVPARDPLTSLREAVRLCDV